MILLSKSSQCNGSTSLRLSPEQHGWYYSDDIFKYIFMTEHFFILIQILQEFVLKSPITKGSN